MRALEIGVWNKKARMDEVRARILCAAIAALPDEQKDFITQSDGPQRKKLERTSMRKLSSGSDHDLYSRENNRSFPEREDACQRCTRARRRAPLEERQKLRIKRVPATAGFPGLRPGSAILESAITSRSIYPLQQHPKTRHDSLFASRTSRDPRFNLARVGSSLTSA
jgi:hypothetical protein